MPSFILRLKLAALARKAARAQREHALLVQWRANSDAMLRDFQQLFYAIEDERARITTKLLARERRVVRFPLPPLGPRRGQA